MRYSRVLILAMLFVFGCKHQNENRKSSLVFGIGYLYGPVKSVKETEFNSKDKFGEIVKTDIVDIDKWEFDEVGNIISEIDESIDGKVNTKYLRFYDDDGNLNEIIKYDSIGEIVEKTKVLRNNGGNIKEQFRYNKNGILLSKRISTYNKEGLLFKTTDYDSVGNLEGSTIFKHLERKLVEVNDYKSNGELDNTLNIIYDENKNEERKLYSSKGELRYTQKIEFTNYDKHDNWLKSIEYNEGLKKSIKVIEREIEYF